MIALATAPSATARQRLSVRLPSHFRSVAPPTAWISLLNASRPYRNNTIAEIAANRILRLDIRQLCETLLLQQFHFRKQSSPLPVATVVRQIFRAAPCTCCKIAITLKAP